MADVHTVRINYMRLEPHIINIAKICKHNPKSFYSYINERRIVRDNIGPLKILDGIVITTDNDMANTMNNFFSSVFTIE